MSTGQFDKFRKASTGTELHVGAVLKKREETVLRVPRRRVSVSEQKANYREALLSHSLATRCTSDTVTPARVREIVEQLAARDCSGEMLTAVHHIPAREAKFAPLPEWVRDELAAAYANKGVAKLYTHQAAAAQAVHDGRNAVVVTPTASGKTLCYNLPVMNAVLENSDTRAIYLFPTKALAQDQLAEIHDFQRASKTGSACFTYDGDTPSDARKAIRESGHIVLTNPDMLHTGILPHHTRWTRLFENLQYIVLDELHTYRGVFGSHLGNVLRRLRRIAHFYGCHPQFICCSATIANPGRTGRQAWRKPTSMFSKTTARPPRRKFFVFYNPAGGESLSGHPQELHQRSLRAWRRNF